MESILKRADDIVNKRSEEKERQYGNFNESMERCASIASGITGKDITASDAYAILIGLKLARHAFAYKEDNLLDACAYLGALDNFCKEKGYEGLNKENDESE